jgi:hypothetical protein
MPSPDRQAGLYRMDTFNPDGSTSLRLGRTASPDQLDPAQMPKIKSQRSFNFQAKIAPQSPGKLDVPGLPGNKLTENIAAG